MNFYELTGVIKKQWRRIFPKRFFFCVEQSNDKQRLPCSFLIYINILLSLREDRSESFLLIVLTIK